MSKKCVPWKIGFTSTAYGLLTGSFVGGISAYLSSLTANYCQTQVQPIANFINQTFHTPAFSIALTNLPTINQIIDVAGFSIPIQYDLNQLNLSIPIHRMNFSLAEFMNKDVIEQIQGLPDTAKLVCGIEVGLHGAAIAATAMTLTGLLAYTYQHNQTLRKQMLSLVGLDNESQTAEPLMLRSQSA